MKKSIVSVLCIAVLAAVIAIPSIGVETAEASESSKSTTESQLSVTYSDMYFLTDQLGQQVLGCEITNNEDFAINAGFIVNFYDESYEEIGVASSYIPSIAPGEKAFIYVTNSFGEDCKHYSVNQITEKTTFLPATDHLIELRIFEYSDHLFCFAENNTSAIIMAPTVTVVYKLNSEPIAVYSGTLHEEGNPVSYLNGYQTGSVNINCPEEYDDYDYYVTAAFDATVTSSDDYETDDVGTTLIESFNPIYDMIEDFINN